MVRDAVFDRRVRLVTEGEIPLCGSVLEGVEFRPRIIHVITEAFLMGGAQLNTYYSLKYQQSTSHVSLVAGTGGPLVDACQEEGIPSIIIPMRNRLVAPAADLRAVLRLIRHFRRVRPDIVHTHSSKAGMLGRLAARLSGVPVVIHTVHGPSFHDRQPRTVRWTIRNIERILALGTDCIITVADTLAEDMVREGVSPRERVRTVVSGIDFQRFPSRSPASRRSIRESLGIRNEDRLVVSIAHLMKDKGHELLIQAASVLLSAEHNVKFVIVGEGKLRAELQVQIDTLGLADRVLLAGTREDVPDLLAAADIFVQTSWREGLSRSLVEAMYSGLAVVATNVGATREVVRDGETGYLVAPGDIDALAKRIDLLLHGADLRQRLGVAARKETGANRSTDVMGRELEALYHTLMRQKLRGDAAADGRAT